jgi:hypothetical protein
MKTGEILKSRNGNGTTLSAPSTETMEIWGQPKSPVKNNRPLKAIFTTVILIGIAASNWIYLLPNTKRKLIRQIIPLAVK